MFQTGVVLLAGATAIFVAEKRSAGEHFAIWKTVGIVSVGVMLLLTIWGFVNGIWNAHPLGFMIALAGCSWVFYRGMKSGKLFANNIRPKALLKGLIIIVIGAIIFGGAGYFFVTRINNSSQVIPPEELVKNNGADLPTATPLDTNSIFLEDEMARKKQRDIDREKCVANIVNIELNDPGHQCKASALTCATLRARVNEEIDGCYFRFPNN